MMLVVNCIALAMHVQGKGRCRAAEQHVICSVLHHDVSVTPSILHA